MAPIKFEEHLRDKLEKRTIQPTAEGWEALEDRLDNRDKKRNTKTFWWLGIAASIVGIVLVTVLFFNRSEPKTTLPVIVNTPVNEKTPNNVASAKEVESLPKETTDDMKPEAKSSVTENQKAKVPKDSKLILPRKATPLKKAVVSNGEEIKKQNDQVEKVMKTPVNNADFEEAKLNDVVAEINRINMENQGVSEAEIDSLLKQAEREILNNRIYNEKTRTVDADALLQDVEVELEQSFRTRVFEALKKSYVTVKTAVAERNN